MSFNIVRKGVLKIYNARSFKFISHFFWDYSAKKGYCIPWVVTHTKINESEDHNQINQTRQVKKVINRSLRGGFCNNCAPHKEYV